MKKFDISDPENWFYLCDKYDEWLFWIGEFDISIQKKGFDGSNISPSSFNYEGMEDVLIGTTGTWSDTNGRFIPKRIVVIQMN